MPDIRYYWNDKKNRAELAVKHTEQMDKEYKNEIQKAIKKSKIYSPSSRFVELNIEKHMTVELVEMDSVEAIIEYTEGKTAVLNFASYKNPGGGFLLGSKAQEECLCHESFLYNVLREFPNYYKWNNLHKNNSMYENRAIYSPEILFEHNKKQVYCDVITCAAPNFTPSLKYGNGVTKATNSRILEDRIKFVLDIAADNKVDTLILGAFGCGVFGQDATEVAELFIKYLTSTHKVFNKVIFAIPTNVHKDNYLKFNKIVTK